MGRINTGVAGSGEGSGGVGVLEPDAVPYAGLMAIEDEDEFEDFDDSDEEFDEEDEFEEDDDFFEDDEEEEDDFEPGLDDEDEEL